MTDKHLNLFYSYHIEESSPLCEDNLTRAFVQVLRALSVGTRGSLLHSIIDPADESLRGCDFSRAEFALQNHFRGPAHEFRNKRIVTIATHAPEPAEATPEERPPGGSRPDAWIYDTDSQERSYCLLIECKRGGNEIDPDQLRRHAWEYPFHAVQLQDWRRQQGIRPPFVVGEAFRRRFAIAAAKVRLTRVKRMIFPTHGFLKLLLPRT
jgi:hypothetical protein